MSKNKDVEDEIKNSVQNDLEYNVKRGKRKESNNVIGTNSTSVFYLTKAMKEQFLEREFTTVNDFGIIFSDIKTAADIWFYLENHFINSLFWESAYGTHSKADENAMNILHENRVLGVPRLRQLKVRSDSCTIHSHFRKLFVTCYGAYANSAEDMSPFGPETNTAWIHSPSTETACLPYRGELATYDGGGFYVDFPRNKTKTIDLLLYLKDNLWITRGTRAVFLDFSVYNANLNIFAWCKLIFEFPTSGGVIPTADFQSVRLLRFHKNFDWFVLACQCCCYVFLIFYFCEEIREMVYYKCKYLTRFWNSIDLLIIVLFLITLLMSIRLIRNLPVALKNIEKFPLRYGNLEYVTHLNVMQNNINAIALFFLYVKAFKFLNVNRTMGQLNETLNKCAMDVLGFSVMFFIIFFAYAELGYLLFGNQVVGFSSFGTAMFTLLRTILGDFDYQEIEEANPVLAPVYFLTYIFLVFFVLLNMFLAIIAETYETVKTEIAIAPNELQMTEYVQTHFGNILRKLGCGRFLPKKTDSTTHINATIREIRQVLKKFGYSDLEIEMFFARYNISPSANMNIGDSDKLVQELNDIAKHEENPNENDYVRLNDFVSQQERLKEIEKAIGDLVRYIKTILDRLETMENVKKERKK